MKNKKHVPLKGHLDKVPGNRIDPSTPETNNLNVIRTITWEFPSIIGQDEVPGVQDIHLAINNDYAIRGVGKVGGEILHKGLIRPNGVFLYLKKVPYHDSGKLKTMKPIQQKI